MQGKSARASTAARPSGPSTGCRTRSRTSCQKVFNPEFLNRLDDVIVFHPLTREHIAQIVTIMLQEVQKRLGDEIRLTPAAHRLPGRQGLRRELRRAAVAAGHPAVRRGSAQREAPDRARSVRGDEIEVDVAPDGDRLTFRALSPTPALRPDRAMRDWRGRARPFLRLTPRTDRPGVAGARARPWRRPGSDGPAGRHHRGRGQQPRPDGPDRRGARASSSASPSTTAAIQRAITALFRTGQFDDVRVEQRGGDERLIIAIMVKERPILQRWAVRGAEQALRGRRSAARSSLVEGRPDRPGRRRDGPGPRSTRSTRRRASTPPRSGSMRSTRATGRSGSSSTSPKAIASPSARSIIDGNTGFPDDGRRGRDGLEARRVLVVPEGRVQRGQARRGPPRAAAPVVRRPRLHRLPGAQRHPGLGLRAGQGDPAG